VSAVHRSIAAWLLTSALSLAQQLPQRSATGTAATDAELFTAPPLVLEAAELPLAPPSDQEVERARRTRDGAKAKAERWSRLQRSGVFSKVEVEQATRQASQASVRYQQLHVARLQQQVKELRERPADAALIESAEAALRTAETLRAAAEESWKKLDRALAETNLARRRALARSGLGSKSELRRAESEVARVREAAR
jgi:multidrug resistance efflux pump